VLDILLPLTYNLRCSNEVIAHQAEAERLLAADLEQEGAMLRGLLLSWYGKGCPLPGLSLWYRLRWLAFILLGLASMGYALFLVRAGDTINRVSFYWFFYSGALVLVGGLVEQGNNLERRG
jgi:hypothetical protein